MWQAFLGLNLADIALTDYLLAHGGIEANPILSSTDHWIAMKLALVGLVILVFNRKPRIMKGLVIGMSLVVGWNLLVLGAI